MYKINKLCGINDYSVTFNKKIEIKRLLELFKDYKVLEANEDMARLSKDDKKLFIYSYGEIVFINFEESEVKDICDRIEKL